MQHLVNHLADAAAGAAAELSQAAFVWQKFVDHAEEICYASILRVATIDARWMMGDCMVEDLRRFFAGEKPIYAITEERVEHVA